MYLLQCVMGFISMFMNSSGYTFNASNNLTCDFVKRFSVKNIPVFIFEVLFEKDYVWEVLQATKVLHAKDC